MSALLFFFFRHPLFFRSFKSSLCCFFRQRCVITSRSPALLLSCTRISTTHHSHRLGWIRVDDISDGATLQWGKARDIAWDAVLKSEESPQYRDRPPLAANSLLLKTALTRKADLATLMKRHAKLAGPDAAAPLAVPETHVIDPDDSDSDSDDDDNGGVDGDHALNPVERSEEGKAVNRGCLLPRWFPTAGVWVLKGSESNRGEDIVFLNADSPNDRSAAERVMAAEAGSSAAWVLQRYVESPALVRGKFKFHLRVMVLAVGDLTVGGAHF